MIPETIRNYIDVNSYVEHDEKVQQHHTKYEINHPFVF